MGDKRYRFEVAWSDEDSCFVALCPELDGVSGFGDSEVEAIQEAKVSLELAVETYQQKKWSLPEPAVRTEYSGNFKLRLPPRKHAEYAHRAKQDGLSLNTFLLNQLSVADGISMAMAEIRAEIGVIHKQFFDMRVKAGARATGLAISAPASALTGWGRSSLRAASGRSDS